jgi:tRNA(adenine34) deaminase
LLSDEKIFKIMLKDCKKLLKNSEIPICAIITDGEKIISKGFNKTKNDVLGHAEIIAIKKAIKKLKVKFLNGYKIYVNVEPCIMCSFAIVLSRISELVYVLREPKFGGVYSLYQIPNDIRLNHRVIVRRVNYFEEEFKNLLKLWKE